MIRILFFDTENLKDSNKSKKCDIARHYDRFSKVLLKQQKVQQHIQFSSIQKQFLNSKEKKDVGTLPLIAFQESFEMATGVDRNDLL